MLSLPVQPSYFSNYRTRESPAGLDPHAVGDVIQSGVNTSRPSLDGAELFG